MNRLVVPAVLLSLVPSICSAESLWDAIALAYQTNPTLRAQRAEMRATNEDYVQARAAYGPQVNFTGQVGYEDARVQTPNQFGPTSTTDFRAETQAADLSLVQPLFTAEAAKAQLGGAVATVAAGRETLRQAEKANFCRM